MKLTTENLIISIFTLLYIVAISYLPLQATDSYYHQGYNGNPLGGIATLFGFIVSIIAALPTIYITKYLKPHKIAIKLINYSNIFWIIFFIILMIFNRSIFTPIYELKKQQLRKLKVQGISIHKLPQRPNEYPQVLVTMEIDNNTIIPIQVAVDASNHNAVCSDGIDYPPYHTILGRGKNTVEIKCINNTENNLKDYPLTVSLFEEENSVVSTTKTLKLSDFKNIEL